MIGASDRIDLVTPGKGGAGMGELLTRRSTFVLDWLSALQPPLGFGILAPPGAGKTVLMRTMLRRPGGSGTKPPAESLRVALVSAAGLHLLALQAQLPDVPDGERPPAPEEALGRCILQLFKDGNGPPILLVDEADKGTAEELGPFWLSLGRLLRVLRPRPAGDEPVPEIPPVSKELLGGLAELRVVLAYDEPRLLRMLAGFFGQEEMARALLAEIVCQVYYVAFDIGAKKLSLQVLRKDIRSARNKNDPLRAFLASLEEQVINSNLRGSRQAIAILNKIMGGSFFRPIHTKVAERFMLSKTPADLNVLVAPALSVLALARDRVRPIFREWATQAWDLEPLIFFFRQMEEAFASRTGAEIPDRAALARVLLYIRSIGFRETADAVDDEGAPLLWWYCEARQQILTAWNSSLATDKKELDLLFLFTEDSGIGMRLTGQKLAPGTVTTVAWQEVMSE